MADVGEDRCMRRKGQIENIRVVKGKTGEDGVGGGGVGKDGMILDVCSSCYQRQQNEPQGRKPRFINYFEGIGKHTEHYQIGRQPSRDVLRLEMG